MAKGKVYIKSKNKCTSSQNIDTSNLATKEELQIGIQDAKDYANNKISEEVSKIETIKGEKGDKGDTGITPNIEIGEVTTLESNQKATVENVGTLENPILNFGIPKGEKGDKGEGGEGSGNANNIDDTTISKNSTWSSAKIEDFVLTNDNVMWTEVGGENLSIDYTKEGYLREVEIWGNTIQNEEDLSDIQSVGEKVEGQELYEIPILSCGKNLFDGELELGSFGNEGENVSSLSRHRTKKPIKVASGKTYTISTPNQDLALDIIFYNSSMNFISKTTSKTFVTPSDCHYIKFNSRVLLENVSIQLEEGTVATPYEPYQEDKLTILSPVPLEKVGDVADRIICKDGVWGVEKNIETIIVTSGNTISKSMETANHVRFDIILPNLIDGKQLICNRFIWEHSNNDKSHCWQGVSQIAIFIPKVELETYDVEGCKKWIDKQDQLIFVRATKSPQFIPLPHDQQIKLRTFANKTNISFLTEIEGTIKAQVPKSLGATVNTHTEQISNLNKELDRVKKLEESTVSTVETESDFTTVEATSGGYFEDVKLEGKTLVNLLPNTVTGEASDYSNLFLLPNTITKSNTYTLIPFNLKHTNNIKLTISSTSSGENTFVSNITPTNGVFVFKCANQEFNYDREVRIRLYVDNTVDSNTKYVILEGDHTQNPPSYFEGLKSVGEGTDEIVVSSVNENLCPINNATVNTQEILWYEWSGIKNAVIPSISKSEYKFYLASGIYRILWDSVENATSHQIVTSDGVKVIANVNNDSVFTITRGVECVLRFRNVETNKSSSITNCRIVRENTNLEYTPHQSDKKRLLYYNNETQTWEKPILREWDSIEKHSNGKYYYHQRSGEVVLNGSENWTVNAESFKENCYYFRFRKPASTSEYAIGGGKHICNIYKALVDGRPDEPGIAIVKGNGLNDIEVIDLKTKFTSYDNALSKFKENISNSNIVIVYQLAQEKVYECTNIDLITYANETNYIVESGAIAPKSTLKVHNNISNVVSLLQKKVSLLESNITSYMITQNRMQLASTYSADSVTFKVDYALCSEEVEYNEDLYNLILNNILVGKDNYDYDKMFTMILDYASWNQISWEQFDILVGLMDIQHNPPIEEIPTDDEIVEETPNEIM